MIPEEFQKLFLLITSVRTNIGAVSILTVKPMGKKNQTR